MNRLLNKTWKCDTMYEAIGQLMSLKSLDEELLCTEDAQKAFEIAPVPGKPQKQYEVLKLRLDSPGIAVSVSYKLRPWRWERWYLRALTNRSKTFTFDEYMRTVYEEQCKNLRVKRYLGESLYASWAAKTFFEKYFILILCHLQKRFSARSVSILFPGPRNIDGEMLDFTLEVDWHRWGRNSSVLLQKDGNAESYEWSELIE